ncbi:hypothetical protein Q5P01_001197 [Channa striata]|uniref:Pentraxin (PTX) domain-containing protein n=1 Tax=Channa striata TaxID=64152 RepID=A0AA88T6W1_CHASR|nr:hypothetical protein Q5P01_001197 [Channa striata]
MDNGTQRVDNETKRVDNGTQRVDNGSNRADDRRSWTKFTRLSPDYFPWTTPSPYIGVSVCLRYITDYLETKSSSIFTLSPSSNPLRLGVSYANTYWLSTDEYSFRKLYLDPSIRVSSNVMHEIWTRVCLTVDSRRNVAQVFSGGNMSIRKFLPNRYMWSGDGTIVFSGFNGQVTDVQVWDYPLRYGEVFSYMNGGVYWQYAGSVLSWSYVRFSVRGKVLLEDAYEWQGKQLVSRRDRGRQLKSGRFFRELDTEDSVR